MILGTVSARKPDDDWRLPMTSSAEPAESYSTGQRWIILLSAILGYVTDGYNLLIITFALPSITTSLGISAQQAGTIITVQLVASIIGGALFGRIADSHGRKKALTWSIALFSVGALLSAFSWNYTTLLLTRLVAGIGLGGEWGVGMALFNEAWKRHRGLGASVIQSSLPVGSLLAGVVAAQIIATSGPEGWRWSLATGCLPLVLCVVIRIWMPESKVWLRSRNERPARDETALQVFREVRRSGASRRWLLAFGLVLGYMISYYSVTSWMPTFIVETYDQGPSVWQEVNTFAVWVVVPLKIAFGLWGDKVGRKTATLVPAVFTLMGSIGILVVSLGGEHTYPGSIWVWSLFWLFFLWSMGNAQASLMGAWLPESFETRIRATATSTAYMFGRGVSALAPSLVAVLAFGNLGVGMGVASLVGVVLFVVCAILLPETKPRNPTRQLPESNATVG
ncbi:MFS transporter [Pseudonocardia sp. MH-G8]|uniref:MFS transporter n=1 Tax=Pseudonocardia sp. MH-G8 TaxID=1854588 RepID=UPI000BA16C24|nr:MFS transporter [Pseudonocardia sp. MH-G8]OZM77071.1 MFS transporter [Pseudonocardia sp. MH-G8]